MHMKNFTANNETAARCLCYVLRDCPGISLKDKLASLQFDSVEDLFKKIAFKTVEVLKITVKMLDKLKPEYGEWLEIIHSSAHACKKK